MNALVQGVKNFWKDEEGVTAIEYGLLAALVALAITTGATALGGALDSLFTDISGKLGKAVKE